MNDLLHTLLFAFAYVVAVVLAAIFVLAILVDLISVYLWIQRLKKGYGPSGIIGCSFFVYGLYSVALIRVKGLLFAALVFFSLFAFHVLCHFIIPMAYAEVLKRRRRRSE